MLTVSVIFGIAILLCLFAFGGTVIFTVGLFGKKRRAKRVGALLFVFSILGLVACFAYSSAKLFGKVKRANPKHIWETLVDAAFDDTRVPPLENSKARQVLTGLLTNSTFLDGVEIHGAWVSGVFLSYGCFIYKADEKALLDAVANSPADPMFHLVSDTSCLKTSWDESKGDLLYSKGPQSNLPGWAPEKVEDKHCYRCFRAPWHHTILIDGKTGKIFHFISEVRE